MTAEAHAEAPVEEHGEHTHHGNYVRIWAILVVLLAVSVVGPMFGIRVVTLITAFGIAVVKAYMVAANFMHITLTPRYVSYIIMTCLVFMLLFFAGVAPDVRNHEGTQWEKPAWIEAAANYVPGGSGGDHH